MNDNVTIQRYVLILHLSKQRPKQRTGHDHRIPLSNSIYKQQSNTLKVYPNFQVT